MKPAKKPETKAEMVAYLRDHFRYHTMNACNQSTSYAANVKLHRLTFPSKAIEDAAWKIVCSDTPWWRDSGIKHILESFELRHNYTWQIGTNGRSGGYLVLYQGFCEPSGYKSICEECGQLNFREATTEHNECGRCHAHARLNFPKPHMKHGVWPGKPTDMHEDFESWDMSSLRSRTTLVWDFDNTVEQCLQALIAYCRTHRVRKKTVMVPQEVEFCEEVAACGSDS